MNKKLVYILVALLLCALNLPAATLEEIMESAKENSPTYQNILISYESSLLNLKSLEKGEKVGVSVNGTVNPLLQGLSDKKGIKADGGVSVSLPGDGNTTLSMGLGLTSWYDGSSTTGDISLSASHTFDFTGYSSATSSDLTLAETKYSTEMSRKRSELSFEKSVISSASMVLSYEKNLLKSRNSLESQKKSVEDMKTLGTYSSSSSIYTNAVNTLSRLEATVSSSEIQLENAKKSFSDLTGMEWDGLDVLEAPVLEVKTYASGNTSVLLKSLAVEREEETYRKQASVLNPSSLSLKGSVATTLSDSSSVSLSATASYTGPLWTLSAAPGVTITENKSTPTLTISGTWNNGGKTSTTPEDTLSVYANNVLRAQNDYIDALSQYESEAQSLRLKVLSWESSYSSTLSQYDYYRSVAENERMRYELGLSTKEKVESAELDEISALYDLKTTILEGLSLERDLAIFAL